MITKYQRPVPIFPILFASYPILTLVAHNIGEADPLVGLRPLLIAIVVIGIGWGINCLLWKDSYKSALFTSAATLLFFSYGHIFSAIQNSSLKSLLGHHRVLAGIGLLLLSGLGWVIWKAKNPQRAAPVLNLISLVLVLSSVYPIINYQLSLNKEMNRSTDSPSVHAVTAAGEAAPDVYYIILDSYTRADALSRDFDLDTSNFLQEMQSRGFFIADCARSNYSFTELSMASALNMNYVDQLNPEIKPGSKNLTLATALIKRNLVRQQFEALGYKIVAFETGYAWNYWEDADLFLSDESNLLTSQEVQPFEYLLMDTTALKLMNDLKPGWLSPKAEPIHHARHVKRTLFELDQLGRLPDLGAPKFIYAHINVPHVPFVFKSDGSLLNNPDYYRGLQDYPVTEEYFIAGYRNQVEFINSRIIQTVDQIIKNSKTPPVIIIQGDHGIRELNRLQILNLYLIPGGSEELYSSITPVNSFRVIFNTLFQGKFTLLDDLSYNSTHELPYDLEKVDENSAHCLRK